MAQEVVSGVGARYAVAFGLDTDGLPTAVRGAELGHAGTLVEGLKSLPVTDPEAQRVSHYGDDNAYAQDSLPPTEVGSFNIVTGKTNLPLDAYLGGQKLVTINGNKFVGVNTDKRGSEPQVAFFAYRQALDTKKGSATFGSLRQWENKFYPSVRISAQSAGFEQGTTDQNYTATPTPVTQTPWAEAFSEGTWGHTQAEAIKGTTDYQPRINVWRGNGSRTGFTMTHAPVDADSVTVWVQDTGLVTPSAVSVSAPNFTLGAAPAAGKLVLALIETNAPGNS